MSESKEYRPIPFWSWNDKLKLSNLTEQTHWMKENGMGGFFMHARSGLQTEYLSEEWMQCIDACVKEAKKLDMKAWVYDENGWPSGFVGGKLLEDEKNCDKYIVTTEGAFDGSATVSYLVTEEELVRVFEETQSNGRYLNLFIHTSVSTADILNPEVVDKFLSLTHEKYKERYGEKFSEEIEGFFTDEPQYFRWNTPYTDMVAKFWQEQYHKDIFEELGLLFLKKRGYKTFRYRYWKAMQSLMLENFAERVFAWCEKNQVKLTGHYIEETSLAYQMLCCAGIMPFYEYEHIPGIDWLGKDTYNELPPKQVSSVAAQLGKKQVITETFGCCGWDVLPSELRRIASFQYVNGVNMMCHHLIPYSERGSRKYDFPAHYSTINPWVQKKFKQFNDYYTELGCILGEGKKHVNVAVLHPIRSAYFEYQHGEDGGGESVKALDMALSRTCKLLSSHGIDYHFLDETLLAKYGYVEDCHIGCGECIYDYVVLSKTITMDKSTEALIRKYIERGGKLLLLEGKPEYVEAEPFEYTYMETNTSIEEIMKMQPYRVKEFDTDIYSTYRTLNGRQYLYVMNSSVNEKQIQTFDFGPEIRSFIKLDLLDISEEVVPLMVTLKPGEDAILIPSHREPQQKKILQPYKLYFENAKVSVKENYLPIDYVCYSTDGKEYSNPWPCAALFQRLIKERYQGQIFLRYEFEVDSVPRKLFLRAEKSRDRGAWLNGEVLQDKIYAEEDYINMYDITSKVVLGKNQYTVQVDWFENENVYFALFGENVTESLKNCLVYDTELQPIELVGEFGVYPRKGYTQNADSRFVRGDDFYIGKLPEYVTQPCKEGFPFLAGDMTLSQKVNFESTDILLQVAGEYQMALTRVNGIDAGVLFFDTELDISHVAKVGENDIEITFVLGNRNRMGPHHLVGSKDSTVDPKSFEMLGFWKEDKSELYHRDYDIKKFYEKDILGE